MCCRDVCLLVREQRDSENAGKLCGPVPALPTPPARLQPPARPPAGRGSGAGGDAWGRRGRGRRLPVPAFRGRLPSPWRSPSRGQGRGDVQYCGVRGVQRRVVNQKERSKGSPDVDSRRFKTSLDTVSKMCVQLSHVLIFALIPSFKISFRKDPSPPPPPYRKNLKRSRLEVYFCFGVKKKQSRKH